jgi:hypothetical protein
MYLKHFSFVAMLLFSICISSNVTAEPNKPADPNKSEKDDKFLMEPGVGMGKLHFGMTKDDMISILGQPQATNYVSIYDYRTFGVTIFIRAGLIWGISCSRGDAPDDRRVDNCRCQTTRGIKIGSTKQQIIEAYGEPTTIRIENRFTRMLYKTFTMDFRLKDDKVVHIGVQSPSLSPFLIEDQNFPPNQQPAEANSIGKSFDEQVKEQLKHDPLISDFDKKISEQEQLLAGIRATRGENDPQIRPVQDLISQFKEEKQKREAQIIDQTRRAAENKLLNKTVLNSTPAGDPIVLHFTKQKQELELELEKYSLMRDQNSQRAQQQLREQISTVKQEIQQREEQVAEQARRAAEKKPSNKADPNSLPARQRKNSP